jgi:nicotinamide-nucleotide amidase
MMLPDDLIEAARKVVDAHRAAGTRIALAESCTGGLVAAAITAVPGASDVLEAAIVSYSNGAKKALLGVHDDVLDTFGAVSVATAWAMAQGVLTRTAADVGVAITGIAGPAGGSDKKPVGHVVFARAFRNCDPDDIKADYRDFGDLGRDEIRHQAALCALELLLPDGTDCGAAP